MTELRELAKAYLNAEGYDVEDRSGNLLDGRRAAIGGTERILVWVPNESASRSITRRLAFYIGEFGTYADRAPNASKFLLMSSTAGLTTDFRKTARYLNVRILVPAQFFDTEMRWEMASTTLSPSKRLADDGRATLSQRVPQPASFDFGAAYCDDLLPVLFEALRSKSGTPIHLVVGPAGMGKSYLFEALYSQLYDRFQADKRGRVLSRRPFALLPDHLRRGSASSASVGSILADYLGSEFARNLNREVFEWRLTNGGGVWLIDGLDEIIARDADFFTDLFDLETTDGTTSAKILICVRDSLLSTDPALREFCAYHSQEMTVYRLAPWNLDLLDRYANGRFDRAVAKRFVRTVSGSGDLQSLASVPFYASMLADEFETGALDMESGRVSLLASGLDRLLDREFDKELLETDVISKESLVEILEALAGKDFEGGLQGVLVSDIWDYAQIALPGDLQAEDLDRHVANIAQLAVFVTAGEGLVRFLQEPIEQYLLGRFLGSRLDDDSLLMAKLAGRPVPVDWISWDVVADEVRRMGREGNLLSLAHMSRFRPGFNNLMRLVARFGPGEVPLSEFPLAATDLSDISFAQADFTGVSFDDANLTNVTFDSCALADAEFKGAILANTGFVGGTEQKMAGAVFGDLSRLHSIRTPDGLLEDHLAASTWLHGRSDVPESVIEPCAAARQLRLLFGKYVTPLGTPRRYKLPILALTRGERAYDPRRTLDEAIRHGYLAPADFRDYIARGDGDHYSEMVEWVKVLALSPGLRDLLDDLCDIPNCVHIPKSL